MKEESLITEKYKSLLLNLKELDDSENPYLQRTLLKSLFPLINDLLDIVGENYKEALIRLRKILNTFGIHYKTISYNNFYYFIKKHRKELKNLVSDDNKSEVKKEETVKIRRDPVDELKDI